MQKYQRFSLGTVRDILANSTIGSAIIKENNAELFTYDESNGHYIANEDMVVQVSVNITGKTSTNGRIWCTVGVKKPSLAFGNSFFEAISYGTYAAINMSSVVSVSKGDFIYITSIDDFRLNGGMSVSDVSNISFTRIA